MSTALTAASGSHTYNVGPGKTYTTLTAVPWLSLAPGDVVNIYYQAAHYNTKLAIQAVGTAAKPIIINGVTDASCNRPVIDGANAVESTDSISSGFWSTSAGTVVESLGVVVFLWGPNQDFATLQSYITIQNVEVTGARSGNTFTNHSGAVTHYATGGASGIYGVAVQYVTIQYNTVDQNDQGIFINSQDQQRTSYYVTLRGNNIHDNGAVGDESVHAIYVQGVRSLYEGNFIGANIAGSLGGGLKDRSSGTVIRNNYIQASLRAIDMVDSESSPEVLGDALYNNAWVYGNVIDDDCSLAVCSADLIHWGGDSGNPQFYHNGTMFSYNNTIVVHNSPATFQRFGIWDMPTNQQSVDSSNDVIIFRNNAANDLFELGINAGTINLQNTDWLSTGYVASGENGNTVTLHTQGTVLTGSNPGLNADLTLSTSSGSPLIGAGVQYPATAPSGVSVPNLRVTGQYANTYIGIVARPNTSDLGAYAAH